MAALEVSPNLSPLTGRRPGVDINITLGTKRFYLAAGGPCAKHISRSLETVRTFRHPFGPIPLWPGSDIQTVQELVGRQDIQLR